MFDLIQCLVERCLYFGSTDVRTCYKHVSNAIDSDRYRKVVLIVHSQGGIAGSIMVDWLINQFDHTSLSKLEVYTFGSAANHFSNPRRKKEKVGRQSRAIGHIEHYANNKEFVARWGVLNLTKFLKGGKNTFFGTVFERQAGGHLLNQHYLDYMFPLNKSMTAARDPYPGDFMHSEVFDPKKRKGDMPQPIMVHQLSRLWQYRNGMSPPPKPQQKATCHEKGHCQLKGHCQCNTKELLKGKI
jgi:hypothetical protein